jgi:hypothetical protein
MKEPTHEGWFWVCPILATINRDDGIEVEARWAWLEPLFTVCEVFESTRIWLTSAMFPDYEPTFMFKLRERQPVSTNA